MCSTRSSLDYSMPAKAHCCSWPHFLICLCGWVQPSTCDSGGSHWDLLGPWMLPTALLQVQVTEMGRKHPILTEASGRTQAKGRPDVPVTRSSSAPTCNLGGQSEHWGARGQQNPIFPSSFCEMAEGSLHVCACSSKPGSGKCSNHDRLSTACPARRPLGSAPTPTARPLAVQQFIPE